MTDESVKIIKRKEEDKGFARHALAINNVEPIVNYAYDYNTTGNRENT